MLSSLELSDGYSLDFGLPNCSEGHIRHNFALAEYFRPDDDRPGFWDNGNYYVSDTLFFLFAIYANYEIENLNFIIDNPSEEIHFKEIEQVAEYSDVSAIDYPAVDLWGTPIGPSPVNIVVYRVVLNGLVYEDCEVYLGGDYEFDVVATALWPLEYDPKNKIPMYLHVGRLADPWDENEYTFSNFLDLPMVSGEFVATDPSEYQPVYARSQYVFADGNSIPAYLSNYVLTEPGDPGELYDALPHPEVACNRFKKGASERASVYIEGTLLIDMDYCFSSRFGNKFIWDNPVNIGLRPNGIYMGPDAKIIVQSGVELTLERTLVTSCETLWNSIVVEDGGILNIHDSYIRDGIHAIKVEEGGTVNISNNIFDANHVSFYTPPKGSPGRYSIDMGPFYGNEFVNINELKAYPDGYSGLETDQPYAAIKLNDLNMFIASGIGKLGEVKKNTIHDIPNGILAENSGISIKNYHIKNAFINGWYGGFGIVLDQSDFVYSSIVGNGKNSNEPNIEDATNVGIYIKNGINSILDNVIQNSETGVQINQDRFSLNAINGNKIDASQFGILNSINHSGGLRIMENEINMSRNNPFLNGELVYGMYLGGFGLHNSGGTRIEDNEVNMKEYSDIGIEVTSVGGSYLRGNTIEDVVATDDFKGIKVINSPNSLIDYNNVLGKSGVSYPSTAIFLGDNPAFRLNCNTTGHTVTGINVVLENNGSELKGNVIGEHDFYGLLYGYQSQPAIFQPTHLTGIQEHHGNIWDYDYKSFPATGAVHTNIADIANRSRFFVDSLQNSKFTTTRQPKDWFKVESTSLVTWQCPEERPVSPHYDITPKSVPTDLDTRIAVHDQPFKDHNFEVSLTYIARRNLYHRIMDGYYDSGALSGTALDTFLTEVENTSIEEFHDVIHSMEDELSLDQSVLDQLYDLSDSLNWNISELIKIDSLAWIDTASVDTTQWLTDRGIVAERIHSLSAEMDSVYTANEPDPSSIVSTLNSALNGVSISNPPEGIEKQMLKIIVDKVFVGDLDFTGQQRTKIIEISEYCPAYGGTGVYWARNLRTTFDSAAVYVDTLCAGGFEERRVKPQEEKEEDILIYPNPGTDDIYVQFNGLEFEQWEIIDLKGRVIKNGQIQYGEDETQLKVDFLKNGQYILRFTGDDKQISKPLIIFRL